MQMACIMMRYVVTEYILCCLNQMQANMERQENGLCILEKQLLSPLPAQQGGQQTPPKPSTNLPPPPGTPRPNRRVLDDLHKRSVGPLHPPLLTRRPLVFEIGDEDKENDNHQQKEEEQIPQSPLADWLSQLLHKWEQDVDYLLQRVLDDLNDFRLKHGIRTS
ncbi:hypothetical protein [human papillomavirus 147]|uniref:E4 protein n=1 Tax=human papillomavirus 147 TaxID=1070420 RepID=I6MRG6_9PAPI|nr:hypothetical protein [human papillomavirus 147]